jgi:hypothetical protein
VSSIVPACSLDGPGSTGRYPDRMATPSRDTDKRERLAYETATPEQVAEARVNAHRRLADSEANHTPEYWAALRERLGLPARAA